MTDLSPRTRSEHMRELDEREERLRERRAERCWLAKFAPAELRECSVWPIDPCHLIPKRLLKVEFPHGVVLSQDGCMRLAYGDEAGMARVKTWDGYRSLDDLVNDPRIIVPGCRQHHDHLDKTRKLKILRKQLPASVEEFAEELGRPITSWLDREYGERLGI